jgi:hypothetical protein
MSVYDEFLPYRDQDGLNQLTTLNGVGVPTQNGTLFTVQYFLCLLQNDCSQTLKDDEIIRIANVFESLELKSGLSKRSKNSTEVDSMDNETALLTFSALFYHNIYSEQMMIYGEDVKCQGYESPKDKWLWILCRVLNLGQAKYFWNVANPNLFNTLSWFGRSPAFMGLLKMTSGKFCNPILTLSVLVGQFLGCTSPASNTDARTLSYVIWQYLNTRSFIWRLFYRIWCWQLLRVYPNGIKDVYRQYYTDQSHPIIKYSKKF